MTVDKRKSAYCASLIRVSIACCKDFVCSRVSMVPGRYTFAVLSLGLPSNVKITHHMAKAQVCFVVRTRDSKLGFVMQRKPSLVRYFERSDQHTVGKQIISKLAVAHAHVSCSRPNLSTASALAIAHQLWSCQVAQCPTAL